jgi:hypothetical protein
MKKTSLATILILTAMLVSTYWVQPISSINEVGATEAPVPAYSSAGYDSANITIVLVTPANQSTLVGTANLNFTVTSVNGPLNLTLFIEDDVYPSYNHTEISPGPLTLTVNTTTLSEGNLNFTILLEDNSTGTNDKETYHLIFNVNNHGAPSVVLLSPTPGGTFTGLDHFFLNISSDYAEVYLNISIDGVITSEYNKTLVPRGLGNYTVNGSRYENGHHLVKIVVFTEEGLKASVSETLVFLDYVRFLLNDIAEYAEISGNFTFDVTVSSPANVTITLSTYVDGVFDSAFTRRMNQTSTDLAFSIDTTQYSEGNHNFTFTARDQDNHTWTRHWIFVVNNHGAPEIEFTGPTLDVVVGNASFTVNIVSNWDYVTVLVYVDETNLVGNYSKVAPGEFTFFIDTSAYSKWQHSVEVKVITQEGLSAETDKTYGFANIKPEEIVSLAILISLAVAIPVYRRRTGQPLRPILIMDCIYVLVVAAAFAMLGITNLPFLIWHINLGSIWILGSIIVFLNWVFPLLREE